MNIESDGIVPQRGWEFKELPSRKYLRECFDYDPETGELKWIYRPREHFDREVGWKIWTRRFAGTVAGDGCNRRKNGKKKYSAVAISILGRGVQIFQVTRIICGLMGVNLPKGHLVDHINHDIWDNRWCNLRVVTASQNQHNKAGHSKWSLPKGVSPFHGKFRAVISVNKKQIRLGIFVSVEEAANAYARAARAYHGEFACLETRKAPHRLQDLGPPMIFMWEEISTQ